MTLVEATERQPFRTLIGSLFQAGLSYLRWTQTVPMILAWAFALLAMLAVLFVGFQDEGFAVLIGLTDAYPELSERLGQRLKDSGAVSESGEIKFTGEMIIPWLLRGWGILAALLMVFDWLKQRLHPSTSPPRALRRKLAIALVATVVVVSIMFVGSAFAEADVAASVLPVLLIGVLLFGVSAYSISVSHLIGKLQEPFDPTAAKAKEVEEVKGDDFLSID